MRGLNLSQARASGPSPSSLLALSHAFMSQFLALDLQVLITVQRPLRLTGTSMRHTNQILHNLQSTLSYSFACFYLHKLPLATACASEHMLQRQFVPITTRGDDNITERAHYTAHTSDTFSCNLTMLLRRRHSRSIVRCEGPTASTADTRRTAQLVHS